MEEEASLGRISYNTIYSYIKCGTYPEGFSKSDKGSLRKRAKYFFIKLPFLIKLHMVLQLSYIL